MHEYKRDDKGVHPLDIASLWIEETQQEEKGTPPSHHVCVNGRNVTRGVHPLLLCTV